MTSSRHTTPRQTFADHYARAFGRRLDSRKLRSRALLVLGISAVLVTGAASADWKVYDSRVEDVLEKILKGIGEDASVNDKLKEVNQRLTLDGRDFDAGGNGNGGNSKLVEPKEAADKLPADKAKPTEATGVDLAARCGTVSMASGDNPKQQNKVCTEIYNTEIARYRFSLEMYELAKTRNEKLQDIVSERNALTEKDFAKMEENTNKLTALQVQMDNDRDRYQTYMQAYEARMVHLQKASDLLAKKAINGESTPGLGGVLPSIVGGGVLAAALSGLETNPDCKPEARRAGICN